jgi:nicotinate-nucleotide adenylyltransferase
VDQRRRVGVFGGTFDPPHVAHVVLVAAAVHQLRLDELIVTVAGVPWQKVGTRVISPPEDRLRMSEIAFEPVDRVTVSDIELRREGNSYTIDTLAELHDDDTDLFLLLGADTAAGLDTWRQSERLAELADIAVFPRRGYDDTTVPEGFDATLLELPGLEVSSSDLRRRVPDGRPIQGLVPPQVVDYIFENGLFGIE